MDNQNYVSDALNSAYTERANLVALLAQLYPSCWNHGDPTCPDWFVVYIELPTGQASWHVSPEDWWIFTNVPHGKAVWDGHTTPEKYQRIRDLIGRPATPNRWAEIRDQLPDTQATIPGIGSFGLAGPDPIEAARRAREQLISALKDAHATLEALAEALDTPGH